ncbi:MAG: hypothetical protein ACP5DY_00515 [Thermovirgaceae bacterium]
MKRLFKKLAISGIIMGLAVWASTGCGGATTGAGGYRILIEAVPGGSVVVVREQGEVLKLGSVLSLPSTTRWPAFTASKWGKPGTVVATAVNAVHILVDIENGRGKTVSILPKDSFAPAAGENTFYLTDIPPGRGLFGAWAPTVGSRVIFRENVPVKEGRNKTTGPSVEIIVTPEANPWFVEIENRPGGRIIAWTNEGPQLLGRVVRPLAGCGRFGGTQFQRTGRIRANHPGVIDVCTSPEGVIGGFQILPLEHASSPEMETAWKLSQWLIVAPEKGTFTGTKPLFSSGFVPGPAAGEKLWDLWSTYGRRSLVLVRENGGPWQWMPRATGRNDTALERVTHLRLYFPSTGEPQKAAGTR